MSPLGKPYQHGETKICVWHRPNLPNLRLVMHWVRSLQKRLSMQLHPESFTFHSSWYKLTMAYFWSSYRWTRRFMKRTLSFPSQRLALSVANPNNISDTAERSEVKRFTHCFMFVCPVLYLYSTIAWGKMRVNCVYVSWQREKWEPKIKRRL